MKKIILAAAGSFALAACGSDNDPDPEAATAQLSVIHASSDAPAVDIELNGFSFGRGVDFKQAVPNQSVTAGSAELVMRGILPDLDETRPAR